MNIDNNINNNDINIINFVNILINNNNILIILLILISINNDIINK